MILWTVHDYDQSRVRTFSKDPPTHTGYENNCPGIFLVKMNTVNILKTNWVIYNFSRINVFLMDHGRTPSSRATQESGSLQERRTFTYHNPTDLHTVSGCEVCLGISMFVPVIQLSLYKHVPVRKLSRQRPYPDSSTGGEAAGPYFFNVHDKRKPKHQRVPGSRPDPMSCHPPGHISSRRPRILAQRP